MTAVLTKSGEETQRPREEGHVTAEAEIGVMQLQAKEGQGLPKTPGNQEEARKDSSVELSEGTWPLGFQTSSLQNSERVSFCCFMPPSLCR